MGKPKEIKKIIGLSSGLVSKLRAIGCYRDWLKRDFIVCQSKHEKITPPDKKDHIEGWNLLCRFAARNDVEIPKKKLRTRKKHTTKRYTKYDGTNGFTQWRKLRYEALKRSAGCCECCGATVKSSGGPLHVDHIKPKSIHPELSLELSNLQVLCADCNIGKGNWDETNWREINDERDATEALDMKLFVSSRLLQ